MNYSKVSVIGLGYIGLPTACILAKHGIKVIGVDVVEHIVNSVNDGKLHIVEPGLSEVLKEVVQNGKLRATTKPELADAFIISVPTPFKDAHKPDLSYIEEAAKSIAPVLQKGNLVILESTSPVGTTEKLSTMLSLLRQDLSFPQQKGNQADIQLVHCPESILPGKILKELVDNDRIIGGMSITASERAKELYKTYVKGEIIITNSRTAEMSKLTENSFRDVNIAFANELSIICDKLDINVWELISLANRHPRVNILDPGCGVGGHCIAVDPWFIVDSDPNDANLIKTARNVNDFKPIFVFNEIKYKMDKLIRKNIKSAYNEIAVACLGLAFKPDIDDLRESPAVLLTKKIANLGCKVYAVEPNIKELPRKLLNIGIELTDLENAIYKSDIISIQVAHMLFQKQSKYIDNGKIIVDPVGLLDRF